MPTVSDMRGCISTTINCTTNVSDCRTFSHRRVANVLCTCTPKMCLGVATFGNEFNLQCSISSVKSQKNLTNVSSPKLPFYCQFIPFYNYNQKRWRRKKVRKLDIIKLLNTEKWRKKKWNGERTRKRIIGVNYKYKLTVCERSPRHSLVENELSNAFNYYCWYDRMLE